MKIKRIDTTKLDKLACTNVPCGNCGFPFIVDRGYIWVKKKDGGRICYNCARNYYIVRKERVKWYLPRKDLKKIDSSTKSTKCGICEKIFVTPPNKNYHWHLVVKDPSKRLPKEYEYDVCYECAEATILYRQQYGFWLRGLMSEHFIPCEQCQDKLHEMMMTMTVAFYTQDCITIESLRDKGKLEWQFLLRFLTCGSLSDREVFKPCGKCQKKLQNLWETKELHIGSEIKPAVELWRRMNQVV